MASRPRQPTLAIALEALLQPYIRDSSIRKIAALLIAVCWKAVLVIVLIVITLVVAASIWMALR